MRKQQLKNENPSSKINQIRSNTKIETIEATDIQVETSAIDPTIKKRIYVVLFIFITVIILITMNYINNKNIYSLDQETLLISNEC